LNRLAAAATTLAACGAALLVACASAERSDHWSQRELATLRSLSLDELGGPPRDPSNRVADDPRAAVLGHRLFSDRHLSRDGTVSCATCHDPKRSFQDGRPRGEGLGRTRRRTMTILGSAWAPWLFWDGRKDSLWAQALAPIQSLAEQGMTPARVRDLIERRYESEYEALFGPLPQDARRVLANVGKAIAAFERTLRPSATRFDRYVAGDTGALSEQEVDGLRLFIGEAHCINCHNGPLLTNNDFHNTGVPGSRDRGRAVGVRLALSDPYNCLGRFSDARSAQCRELRFVDAVSRRLRGAFKPPSLRDVGRRAPYMQNGRFRTLHEVLEHYRRAPAASTGRTELEPLNITDDQLEALEAFLRALDAER
jgi:cytochrome c peroxidase